MFARRIIVIQFLLLATSLSAFADEAFDFFVEACRHSGYNPAEISTFQATLEVTSRTTFDEAELKSMLEGLKEGMTAGPQKGAAMEHFRRRFSGEPKTEFIKVFCTNSVATTLELEDTPPKILVMSADEKKSFTYLFGADGQAGVSRIKGVAMIDASGGTQHQYHLDGRIRSSRTIDALRVMLTRDADGDFTISESGIAAFKKDCEVNGWTFTLSKEKVKYDGDHSASVLEIYEKEELREWFWIDPDRGYICPKVFEYFFPGKPVSELISEDFALDEHSQKWFPNKVVCTSWHLISKQKEPRSVRECRVMPETLVLNQPIPDSVFSFTVKEGTRVVDVRRDDHDKSAFIADQSGTLDLPTVEKKSLDDIPWLKQREAAQPQEPSLVKDSSFSWIQIVLIAVGIAMILLGLVLRFVFGK